MKLGRAMLVVAKPSRSMCSSTNLGSIQKEFSVQSDWFEDNWNARSGTPSKEIMQWVMSVMDIENREKEKVLDVAAGTCIFARSLAQSGAGSVIALDATLEMLKKGEAAAKKEGITNLKCVEGDALHLPFEDSSFDMVACRLCLHHFPDPLLCVQEMTRVVKSGGVVCIVDLTSSEDKASADEMNRLENLRDPTHTYALSKSSLLDMMLTANLKPEVQAPEDLPTLPVLMDLQAWMQVCTHFCRCIAVCK